MKWAAIAVWLFVAAFLVSSVGCTVKRYEAIGFCPPVVGPSVLVLDSRTGQVFCSPIPVDKILLPPQPPRDEKVPS